MTLSKVSTGGENDFEERKKKKRRKPLTTVSITEVNTE